MRLRRVQIKNYRSIKDQSVEFTPACRVLIGINESGKSNVLRALSLLSQDRLPSDEDRRDPIQDEPLVDEAYVLFIFVLDNQDRQDILDFVKTKIFAKNFDAPILKDGKNKHDLKSFCNTIKEGLYKVDVLKKTKSAANWKFSEELEVSDDWRKITESCPPTIQVTSVDGKQLPLSQYKIVRHSDLGSEVPESCLEKLTAEELTKLFSIEITKIVTNNLPKCTLWEYNEANLLPGKINLEAFKSSPTTCLPLKHMFELADITDISEKITEEQGRPNGVRNLLRRVSTLTTKHIHGVWKEYKSVKVLLSENGANIDAGIEDKSNVFNFSRRSDGFKRFITFLLIVSARQRTNQLTNTLLLIDEPDIGLHPSGARYLRDELIVISKNNFVVYSTHSIFMIDRESIGRHLLVTKSNEVTAVTEANQSNIKDEEVLYNALGYSIFENLEKKNIIFEGWRDKKLFKVAISKQKALRDKYEKIGTCHVKGVKDVTRVTPMLELANRQFVIVSDNDQISIEQKKNYDGPGKWLLYSDILPETSAITGEDFVKPAAFTEPLNEAVRTYPGLSPIENGKLATQGGRLAAIKSWLTAGGIVGEEQKTAINMIKEEVFNNLKPTQIEDSYIELLGKLAVHL